MVLPNRLTAESLGSSGRGLTGLVISAAGNSGQVYSDLIRNPSGGLPVLSRLDRRIRAMKGWLYWSLVGMLSAVIVGAVVVITSRVLAAPIGL